ncbi:MAG: NAD(P)H-binding protein [Thalassotalea sp.]|nr:NAD(P)H-binding protein [Thalassotalea sp.]
MDTLRNNSKSEPIRIGIIGCGWLGSALVKALVEQAYYVIATTQQQNKLKSITDLGAQAEILTLPFGDINENSAAVFCCDTLIICIPPGIRKGKKDYPEKIADIIKQAELRNVNRVILISTTAVYEGIIGDVTESAKLKHDIEKVKLLIKAEQHVLKFSKQGIVIRSAGLVGPDRHPGIFFRNKKLLSAPNAYVNLVHQADIIGQILLMIKSDTISGVFNAASDMQVTKKHYYSIAAKALKVPLPLFDEHSEVELGKKVLSDKLRDTLDYHYQYDDLVTWLINSELTRSN